MKNVFWIRIFFLALGLMSLTSGRTQNSEGASLVGTWELRAIEMRGKFSAPDNFLWERMRADGSLSRYTAQSPADTSKKVFEEGSWVVNGDDLIFRVHGIFPDADSTYSSELLYTVRNIADSSLVLSGWNGAMPVHYHFHRITPWEEAVIPKPSFVPIFGDPEEMELRWFCLVRVDKPAKRVRLSPYRSYELIRSESESDAIDTLWHTRSGIVHRAGANGFQFRVRSESLTLDYREKSMLTVDREYFEGQDTVVHLPYGYPAFAIRYQSPVRRTFSTIGTTLMVTGALTALIAAPLSAIDYGGGSFRTERYRNVALAGLAAVTVGIPISLFSRPKEYPIYTPEATHCESWKIIACE